MCNVTLAKYVSEGFMKVADVMTQQLVVCLKSDTVQSVVTLMRAHDIGSLPVVSDLVSKKLEGIVTDRDLCVRLVADNRNAGTTQIGALMTPKPVTCGANDSLQECETLMRERKIRRIPVVDQQGRCVGIVAQADIVLHDSSNGVNQTLTAISTPSQGTFVGARAVA
jgi:CBS domain-containing protein